MAWLAYRLSYYMCILMVSFIIPGDNGGVRITFSDYSVGAHVLTLSASDAAGKIAVRHHTFTVGMNTSS